ncbi:hypothetical protein J2786_000284 [Chryseobacterium vietnamense]|uniref:Uncharacterized protein n=1 Tax=Chryseobacterium vietnamense TaxID=866785 RepID=A0ACC6J2D0_9FLAO|nr:hypothetical protein [Chryseobacterium vietnamense]MDR6457191.1 hypothetical protein [Chryseobacterium vietnamense]
MDKQHEFIQKLTKETIRKQIIWSDKLSDKLNLPNEERAISKLYITEIQGKKFRLYEFQYKLYTDLYEWLWNQRVRLELIDNNDIRIYEFDYNYSLNDLFDAVTRTTSGIDDFIDDFLK